MSNEECNVLLFPIAPNFGLKIQGFINEEIDWEYENSIRDTFIKTFNEESLRKLVLEDICLNFCFKSARFKTEITTEKKMYLLVYEFIPEQVANYKHMNNERKEKLKLCTDLEETSDRNTQDRLDALEIVENLNKKMQECNSLINSCLIVSKNLISKLHSDKFISELISSIEGNNFINESIIYNSVLIIKKLMPRQAHMFRKEEIAQRKWLISSHFDNGLKLRQMIYSKIFYKHEVIKNFEYKNVSLIP